MTRNITVTLCIFNMIYSVCILGFIDRVHSPDTSGGTRVQTTALDSEQKTAWHIYFRCVGEG